MSMTCEHGRVGACEDCGLIYAHQLASVIRERDEAIQRAERAEAAVEAVRKLDEDGTPLTPANTDLRKTADGVKAAVEALVSALDQFGSPSASVNTSDAKRRCKYCNRPYLVSESVAEENPFCAKCLHERVAEHRALAAEQACAAMRVVLEAVRDNATWVDARVNKVLALDAGKKLAERMERLEAVAEVARIVASYSGVFVGSPEKLAGALAMLDAGYTKPGDRQP